MSVLDDHTAPVQHDDATEVETPVSQLKHVTSAPDTTTAVARLLEIAAKNADQLLEESAAEATAAVAEAQAHAEQVLATAVAEADQVTAAARTEAQHLTAEATTRKASLEAQVAELEQLVKDHTTRMRAWYGDQLAELDRLSLADVDLDADEA